MTVTQKVFPSAAFFLVVALATTTAGLACRRERPRTGGIGDALKPFIIQNVETGEQYCQVCAFGGKPTIMAVVDPRDPTLEADLTRLQKLVDTHASEGLSAFVVVAKIEGTRVGVLDDPAASIAHLKETRTRLGISYPVVTLPTKLSETDQKNYAAFQDVYAVDRSRTILFASASNEIVFADTITEARAEAQFGALRDAVTKAL